MRNGAINLGSMSFLLADPNPHTLSITHGILRGFGALKITGVRDAQAALETLIEHRPDVMLCDFQLPPVGGNSFIKFVREQTTAPFHAMPILAMTGDTCVSNIRRTRACGANMVVAKPMSPATLYDRLVWVAFNPHKFVNVQAHPGTDSSISIDSGMQDMPEHRTGDESEIIAVENGSVPSLSQNEIYNMFDSARG